MTPRPPPPPPPDDGDSTTIVDEDVPLADLPELNNVDHFAYIVGYPDGEVKPNANITRAEVATIFFRLFSDETRDKYWSTTNAYPDVSAEDWFNNAVSTTTRAGILKGYPDGTARPTANITRAEFAAIAARFLSAEYNESGDMFSDISGHWAAAEINRAAKAGWIHGYPDGTFRPDQAITRAEAMTLINNMLGRNPDKDHLLTNMIVWPDNMDPTVWYYAAVQEATNSHDYDRATVVDVEDWTALLEVRDWAAFEKLWADSHSAVNPGEVADNLNPIVRSIGR